MADNKSVDLNILDSEYGNNKRPSPDSNLGELSPEYDNVKDYWKYLLDHKSWHSEKDGLLNIIRDMLLANTMPINESFNLIIQEIRDILHDMSDLFQSQEQKYPELDFSNMIMTINLCREVMPISNTERQQDNSEGNELDMLVSRMREYIIDEKLSLEEAFSMFDVDQNGNIEYEEFRKAIKNTLGNVRSADVEKAFYYLDADHDGYLKFKEFSNKLRKYFAKNPHVVKIRHRTYGIGDNLSQRQPTANNELAYDQDVKNSLLDFSELFSSLCKDQDIGILVKKVKDRFVDPAVKSKDLTILTEFISKLGSAFRKKKHKIYLLRILRMLIPDTERKEIIFDSSETENISDYDYLQRIQSTLSSAGVLELALSIINDSSEFELLNEAVMVLIALLKFGNHDVQNRLLHIMNVSDNSNLFSYIRCQLRLSRDRIVDRAKISFQNNPEIAAGIPPKKSEDNIHIPAELKAEVFHLKSLVYLLQLFCENCFTKFQNYLRSQEDELSRKKHLSINMIYELAQFLINIREAGPYLCDDFEARILIPQVLETLIDSCKGPCVENQLLIGKRRKLYKFINMILSLQTENRLFEEYFQSSIRFLSSLLEGELDLGIAAMMIEEIDFKELADIALIIYQNHIYNQMDTLIQERIENSDILMRDSLRAFITCTEKMPERIPVNIWHVIDMGFEIVMMTLRLRESFPYLEELNWISFSDKVPKAEKQIDLKSIINHIEFLKGRDESLIKSLFRPISRLVMGNNHKMTEINMDQAYEFYLSLIGTVEIDRDNKLEICHFRIPALMVFLSSKLKNDVLFKVNHHSHEEKIKALFHDSEKYQIYMTHIQGLSEFKLIA